MKYAILILVVGFLVVMLYKVYTGSSFMKTGSAIIQTHQRLLDAFEPIHIP